MTARGQVPSNKCRMTNQWMLTKAEAKPTPVRWLGPATLRVLFLSFVLQIPLDRWSEYWWSRYRMCLQPGVPLNAPRAHAQLASTLDAQANFVCLQPGLLRSVEATARVTPKPMNIQCMTARIMLCTYLHDFTTDDRLQVIFPERYTRGDKIQYNVRCTHGRGSFQSAIRTEQ